MSIKTDIELRNFFIFNSLYGPKEGEVHLFRQQLPTSNCLIVGITEDFILLPNNRSC
jgi:hypothetical protein